MSNFERLKKINEIKKTQKLDIRPWQFLEIREKIGTWDNKRIWKFKGLVIKVKKPNSVDWTFTIRWKSSGIVVEKIYPLSFPNFDKVILLDEYRIRRAKLYYIREKVGKAAKFKSIMDSNKKWENLVQELEQLLETEIQEETTQQVVQAPVQEEVKQEIQQEPQQPASEENVEEKTE